MTSTKLDKITDYRKQIEVPETNYCTVDDFGLTFRYTLNGKPQKLQFVSALAAAEWLKKRDWIASFTVENDEVIMEIPYADSNFTYPLTWFELIAGQNNPQCPLQFDRNSVKHIIACELEIQEAMPMLQGFKTMNKLIEKHFKIYP